MVEGWLEDGGRMVGDLSYKYAKISLELVPI